VLSKVSQWVIQKRVLTSDFVKELRLKDDRLGSQLGL